MQMPVQITETLIAVLVSAMKATWEVNVSALKEM